MTTNDLIGYAAGLCLMVSFAPQVWKTVRTRKADDISVALIVLSLASGVLYALYAYNLGLVPVIITNGIFSVLVLVQLAYTLRYRKR